ncbi:hypothetical protein HanIR_Chr02g0071011 [Helianthus annuus]|nr:hypothetical protein HanIR_Chr02g0071011 [Helianthus annuus]
MKLIWTVTFSMKCVKEDDAEPTSKEEEEGSDDDDSDGSDEEVMVLKRRMNLKPTGSKTLFVGNLSYYVEENDFPESVIKRFEQREYAVDSKGVVEYIRALVATDVISEYLGDDQSGKPSTLSTLLQELKERASGNLDETFLSPRISERQPLHVMMAS